MTTVALSLDLGIDDEGLKGAAAVVEGDVFVVAWRGFEAGLGPVLRVQGSGGKRKEQEEGEEVQG